MPSLARTRVKICCIANTDEAAIAVRAGADALGLVGAMPSGPGPIADELIAHIARTAPPAVDTFLLTSETTVAGIVAHHRRVHTRTVQLVDALSQGTYAELRAALPGIKLVQVIHVWHPDVVAEAEIIAREVDALLLDSGRPDQPIKELGGTGRVHDWALSAEIVRRVSVPVFLAGGLRSENVGEAIRKVQPYGLDLCTGVRTDGALDPAKLETFMRSVSLPTYL